MICSDPRRAIWKRALDTISKYLVGRVFGAERVARWAGLTALWDLYYRLEPNEKRFEARMLAALDIEWRVGKGNTAKIPKNGGLLIVANHPSGGAEGLIAQALVGAVRDDWRVIGNHNLARLPELASRQIGITGSQADSIAMVIAARHLKQGGALLMFPAGTVAHWQLKRGYSEAPWHPSAARLARVSGATVQPLYFTTTTTLHWKIASAISRKARSFLLPRELLAQRGRTVMVDIDYSMRDPVVISSWFAQRE